MIPVVSFLKQKATYWQQTGRDAFGKRTFSTPIVIDVFWIDKAVDIINRTGEKTVSRSVVYVDREMQIGDYLALGQRTETDPTTLDDAYEIKQFSKVPGLNDPSFQVMKAFL